MMCHRAVQKRRRGVKGSQMVYLVLHQGNQRRYHHRQAGEEQGWNLVAQALASPGGHDHQRIALLQYRFDHLALERLESVISEDGFENGIRGGEHGDAGLRKNAKRYTNFMLKQEGAPCASLGPIFLSFKNFLILD